MGARLQRKGRTWEQEAGKEVGRRSAHKEDYGRWQPERPRGWGSKRSELGEAKS